MPDTCPQLCCTNACAKAQFSLKVSCGGLSGRGRVENRAAHRGPDDFERFCRSDEKETSLCCCAGRRSRAGCSLLGAMLSSLTEKVKRSEAPCRLTRDRPARAPQTLHPRASLPADPPTVTRAPFAGGPNGASPLFGPLACSTRGGKKARRNMTRAASPEAGSLATPRSVVDGSAARRARGGCIDGGSDG